jgi:hypothetical protein
LPAEAQLHGAALGASKAHRRLETARRGGAGQGGVRVRVRDSTQGKG